MQAESLEQSESSQSVSPSQSLSTPSLQISALPTPSPTSAPVTRNSTFFGFWATCMAVFGVVNAVSQVDK